MGPAALILAAASIAGAIKGAHRKTIDPNWLYQNFGPNVVSQETLSLMNNLLNSPYGENLMAQADEQGQQFGRDTNRAAAMAGFGPGSGADTGASVFATSAAKGASSSLERGVKSDFYKMSLGIAQNMVNQRMNAYLQNLGGYQDDSSRIWQSIGNAAGVAGSLIPQGQGSGGSPSQPTGLPYSQSDFATPNTPGIGGIGPDVNVNNFSPAPRLPDVSPMLQPYRSSRFSSMQGAIQPGGQR